MKISKGCLVQVLERKHHSPVCGLVGKVVYFEPDYNITVEFSESEIAKAGEGSRHWFHDANIEPIIKNKRWFVPVELRVIQTKPQKLDPEYERLLV